MNAKDIIKIVLKVLNIDIEAIRSLRKSLRKQKVLYNVTNTTASKRCLLLYITHPFLTDKISECHQNQWQAREIARLISEKGYIVDVVDFNNKNAQLKFTYDMVIGLIPRGIDIYSKKLNPGCIKIAYLTSMNLEITSRNENQRVKELEQRRGISLKPRRFAGYIQKEIESFDAAWYIGNSFNFKSYDCFNMPPSYRIKNSGYAFPWYNPSLNRDPHNFLFFGSLGQVHKGLDLLLEIFAEKTKECTLYICSGYDREEDFLNLYHKELFETPNIKSLGFVDIESETFKKITEQCAYTILPSCAEGCAGSILTTMSAGLIPIVSNVCGFDDDEVITLPDCSIDTICNYILEYSKKDQAWLIENSKKAVHIVEERYSKNAFSDSIKNALNSTILQKKK